MKNVSLAAADPHILIAKDSVEDADYVKAADEFAKAITVCEDGLRTLYAARASALSSAEQFDECLKSAKEATQRFPEDASLWYWTGQALFNKKQLAEAKKSFEKAAALEGVATMKMSYLDWASRCKNEPKTDSDEVMETVDVTGGSAQTVPPKATSNSATTPSTEKENNSGSAPLPQPKVDHTRLQWYQSSSHVTVDIYAKDVDGEQSAVSFKPSHLSVRLKRPNAPDYILDKDLHEDIVVDQSTWTFSRFKVEIRLAKATAGSTWKALDKEAQVLSAVAQAGAESRQRSKAQEEQQKQWASLTEKELENYKEDDSAMSLFRTLYKDADEDVRRAMMKSYQESDGQVLSTNWDEVKKKKVVYEGKD